MWVRRALDLRTVVAGKGLAHDESATQTWERGYKVSSESWWLLQPPFFRPSGIERPICRSPYARYAESAGNLGGVLPIVQKGLEFRWGVYKTAPVYRTEIPLSRRKQQQRERYKDDETNFRDFVWDGPFDRLSLRLRAGRQR